MISPTVAHELVITTTDEKSFAIFRRVSKVTMSQDVVASFARRRDTPDVGRSCECPDR
jgi:hypothetical protein